MTAVSNSESLLIQIATLVLAVLSLGLSWWAGRAGSPVVAVFGRWLRWLFFAFLGGGLVYVMGWTGYPLGVLVLVTLLLWFLIETGYNWLAISALSRSELPLFPKFEENDRGDEWPSSPGFIKLKEWLRQKGFQKKQALVSFLGEQVLMRVSVHESEDETIRLHVMMLPNVQGNTAVCLSFYSTTRAGDFIVTDNIFLPFGGFYPENWDVERRPWMRGAGDLLNRHRERIDAKAEPLIPFVTSPLEQINEDQRSVEQLNRDLGFLHPVHEQHELGRLTAGGKARIWQEIWTLAYLGLPLKY
jgi:hypothetical protein